MIKFPDGELLDLLPSSLKNDTDMICLSYALKKAVERLIAYERSAMTQNFVDSLPEKILDVLAVELRSLYYSDTLLIETKRDIVKNTLRWHMQAGTPGAVAEMVKIVFGEGEVVEWPDFDEPPYTPGTFDIVTSARLTPDILDYFSSIIDRVKNARSHLRRIMIKREWNFTEYAGTRAVSQPHEQITNNAAPRENGIRMEETAAPAATSSPHEQITNNAAPRGASFQMLEYDGGGAVSIPHERITNNMAARASPLPGIPLYGGAMAQSSPLEVATNTLGERRAGVRGAVCAGAVAKAAPDVYATNTKPDTQSTIHACARTAISAFTAPRVLCSQGIKTASEVKYRAQIAAATKSDPKIII